MSTAARKARKRAGIKFERTPKEPTPLIFRPTFLVRSERRQKRELDARGVVLTKVQKSKVDGARPPKPMRQVRNYSK